MLFLSTVRLVSCFALRLDGGHALDDTSVLYKKENHMF